MILPTLSIAICTYNRGDYVLECLDTILNQKIDNSIFEVLIIDNNSTDNTKKLILDFIDKNDVNNTIKYYLEVKPGLSYARNRAIKEAKADLITFVDDDALLEPNFIQETIETFHKNPTISVIGGKVIPKFEGEEPKWRNPFTESAFFSQHTPSEKLYLYPKGKYPVGCNMSFRKEVLLSNGGFDIRLGRKGNIAIGAEEKQLINALNNEENIIFNPKIAVYHQINKKRLEQNSLDKISMGIGITNRVLCDENWVKIIFTFAVLIFKFLAAIFIGLYYTIKEFSLIKLIHLTRFRLFVFSGFLKKLDK